MTLCQGDRRDFVLIDAAGGVHSLATTLGLKAAEVRAYMAGIDRDSLPCVDFVREQIKAARQEMVQHQQCDHAHTRTGA